MPLREIRECARCHHVLVDEDEFGWYYQVPEPMRDSGLTFMDRVHYCGRWRKRHKVRLRRPAEAVRAHTSRRLILAMICSSIGGAVTGVTIGMIFKIPLWLLLLGILVGLALTTPYVLYLRRVLLLRRKAWTALEDMRDGL